MMENEARGNEEGARGNPFLAPLLSFPPPNFPRSFQTPALTAKQATGIRNWLVPILFVKRTAGTKASSFPSHPARYQGKVQRR